MDKHEIIQKLFTQEDQAELIPILPDQWVKRNRNLVQKCMEERYILNKEGQTVDMYNQLWITFRYTHSQIQRLVEISNEDIDNEAKLSRLLEVLFEMESQMPL